MASNMALPPPCLSLSIFLRDGVGIIRRFHEQIDFGVIAYQEPLVPAPSGIRIYAKSPIDSL